MASAPLRILYLSHNHPALQPGGSETVALEVFRALRRDHGVEGLFLAAVTAIPLACPGARLVHAGGPTAWFMRTGSYFANVPEALLLRALHGQLAHFGGLPAGLVWGGTKAERVLVGALGLRPHARRARGLPGAGCVWLVPGHSPPR